MIEPFEATVFTLDPGNKLTEVSHDVRVATTSGART